MESNFRLFLVEDHELFRECIKALASQNEWDVVGEACDGEEAVEKISALKPDLVLLDLSMPRANGFAVLKEIKADLPDIRVLVLTIHESDQFVLQALEMGADGYLTKDSSREELKVAIRSVLEGKRYLGPGLGPKVIEGYTNGGTVLKGKSTVGSLTDREREVLQLLAEGYRNKNISAKLCISVKTVEKHRSNIMAKLRLHNAAALTAFALEHGIITR